MLQPSKKLIDPKKNIIYGDTTYEELNNFTQDET